MMNMLEAVFQRTDENKSKMKTFSGWLSLASFLLPWCPLLSECYSAIHMHLNSSASPASPSEGKPEGSAQ